MIARSFCRIEVTRRSSFLAALMQSSSRLRRLHEREAGMSRERRESLDNERDTGRLEAWSADPGSIARARHLLSGLARDWLLEVSQFSSLVCEHSDQRYSDRRVCDATSL